MLLLQTLATILLTLVVYIAIAVAAFYTFFFVLGLVLALSGMFLKFLARSITSFFLRLFGYVRTEFSEEKTYSQTQKSEYEIAVETVFSLERKRLAKGYKPGWLYFRCKEDPALLQAMNHLRRTGQIESAKKGSHEKKRTDSSKNRSSSTKKSKSSALDPYKVLGVERGAPYDRIKSCYREQMKRYHPDRVSHLGDEFRVLANRKAKEIQQAYEMLSKAA